MENSKITTQIEKLILKTKENKLPWKFANANLVRWVKQEEERLFTVTIQFQPAPAMPPNMPARPNNYVFTIQATNPNEVVMQVNTTTEEDLRPILKVLFENAMIVSKETSSAIIDKLIGDL